MGLQAVRSLILLSGDGAEGGVFFHEHMCILEQFFFLTVYHSLFSMGLGLHEWNEDRRTED